MLGGTLKGRMQNAMSRPTQHKLIIEKDDLFKINHYFDKTESSPIKLMQCVWWYSIAIHFCTRGLEFHHRLEIDSFQYLTDEFGKEYVSLTHETQQKNVQGGLNSKETASDKRMYSTWDPNCPVKMLKLFLKKTDKNAKSLFNSCEKDALNSPDARGIWYSIKPLSKTIFKNFMTDICKGANCRRYTAHCLRATAIQAMNVHVRSS